MAWLHFKYNLQFYICEPRHIATAYMLFYGYNCQCHFKYNITIKLAAILEQ